MAIKLGKSRNGNCQRISYRNHGKLHLCLTQEMSSNPDLDKATGSECARVQARGGLPRAGKDSGDDAVIRDRESKTTRIARCQGEQTFGCGIVCLRSRA